VYRTVPVPVKVEEWKANSPSNFARVHTIGEAKLGASRRER
jgi:hypothetical protein